jgi:hypothetical protein
VIGREDQVTDRNRSNLPDAGSSFAADTTCNDFGGTPTTTAKYAATAYVTCNYAGAATTAGASFVADSALFLTLGGHAPVLSPVQVSRSSVTVDERREPKLGALVTTVTATADGITLPGLVHIGAVSSVLTVSTHGRHGTSRAQRTVNVDDVTVGPSVLCTDNCSTSAVQAALDAIAPGRVRVDFPAAERIASPGGSYAAIMQDPWYHAERVLDGDKADTDIAVPAMTVTVNLDGASKLRLVVDLAAASATSSYRIYRVGGGFSQASLPAPVQASVRVPGSPPPGGGVGSLPISRRLALKGPAAQPGGLVSTIEHGLRLALGSLRRLLELLPFFILLGVPVYLSARRRLLLELPLLSRVKEHL